MKSLTCALTLSAVLVSGMLSGPVLAQSDEPPAELVAAAEKEGRLVYYSSEVDAINEAVVKAFEAKYKIDVEWLRLASGPLASRFAEEKNSGGTPADILRTADGSVFVENPEWFLELSPDLVPMLADYPASAYLENKRSVLTQYSTYVFTYNTNLVDEAELPKKWPDILNERWKGRVVLSDPRTSISWLAWIDAMVKAHGMQFAEAVRKQDWDIVSSAAPGAQQVAAGAYDGSTPAFTGHATPVVQQGAPLKFITPTDPSILKRDHIGIVKDAKHPNAARLFLHYRLSREALELSCKLNEVGAPLADIPGCIEVPENPTTVKDVWTPEEARPLMEALGLSQG
ncbi:iron ABC transporter substrate-binding protein [Agaricicola taiwanensis]|uniref:Iron ABC transporter substrate-binding protein n=1 Tax=Agaricicola taiwanensis TaxID=591372 RepID=A0A8J2YNJ3_9RHOB|nr:extracellular solute-binding protein [Agaricicola taiwanensis]GGE54778.1 iron ABC transporter substrate-binding protein [Agaricicola taiwanensis]